MKRLEKAAKAKILLAAFLSNLSGICLVQPALSIDESPSDSTVPDSAIDRPAPGTKLAMLSSGTSTLILTPEARELASELDLLDLLNRLDQIKTSIKNCQTAPNSMAGLLARQELLEARQTYQKRVLRASLEVDYVLAAIGGEQHSFELMSTSLQNSRDSAVLLTNIAAEVSNGALWVISCSYTLASRTNPKFDFGDGVNGIIAGAAPSLLGLYALYQLKGKARDLPRHPNMLAPLLGTGKDAENYFPKSVLAYLDATAPGQTDSRRQVLIKSWIKDKKLQKADSKKYEHSAEIISGSISQRKALTLSLLDKQMTMLSDLRAVVFSMKKGLLELMPALD